MGYVNPLHGLDANGDPEGRGWPCCIWDLDSTLCDTRHRRHLMPERDRWAVDGAWDEYSLACHGDAPIDATVRLYRALRHSHRPLILSARSDRALSLTRDWLRGNGIRDWAGLQLRPSGNDELRPEEWKRGVVRGWLARGWRIELAVDDHPGTGAMLGELGIPTVVVTPPGVDYTRLAHL